MYQLSQGISIVIGQNAMVVRSVWKTDTIGSVLRKRYREKSDRDNMENLGSQTVCGIVLGERSQKIEEPVRSSR